MHMVKASLILLERQCGVVGEVLAWDANRPELKSLLLHLLTGKLWISYSRLSKPQIIFVQWH